MREPRFDLPDIASDVLARLRERAPRVHCLTNAVAQAFTANMLLAAGAIPSMTIAPEEIGQFVGRSDALLINLGTFDEGRREAAHIAIERATADGKPWVLDPVFIERSRPRTELAQQLAAFGPKAIRLNGAEFTALAGVTPRPEAIVRHAQAHATVLALTGTTDLITDGARSVAISNGHPLMAKVTAMGCAASAIVAGCLAVEPDAWRASMSGLLIVGVAGEIAGAQAPGPGSFATAMLDALYQIDEDTLRTRARLT